MKFDLKLLNLHWLNNEDDPNDRCAHGSVFLQIGNEIISDENSPETTLSSTALYLMRTIKEDYKKGDYASQLLPCCGNFFMEHSENSRVDIIGCPNGIDWEILHLSNSEIMHISESGQEVVVKIEDYKKLVLTFADEVALFYRKSKPKIIPDDEFDKKGYLTFWKEWNALRSEFM